MKLEIITPTSRLYSGDAKSVTVPSKLGPFTMLEHHAAIVAILEAGKVVVTDASDEKKVFPCCCYLEGEYGHNDLCIGVPAVIGKRGCEKIVEYDLTKEEKAAFDKSAGAVKNVNNVLYESKILSR